MATTLFDAIKQSLAAPKPAAQSAPATDQTLLASSLLSAKSGKAAAPSSGPQMSTLQEQMAAGQARAAEDAVLQEGKQAAVQLGMAAEQQEKEVLASKRQLGEQELKVMDDFQRTSESILRDFQRSGQQLDFTKQKARMEQLGVNLRLSNQKYMDELQDNGRRARLDNAVRFKEELTKTIFADETELLNNDLSFRALLRADDRQFQDAMAQMDLDYALQLAAAENKQANQQAMWQGIGGLTQAGIAGYGAYSQGSFNDGYQKYRDAGGTKGYGAWQAEQEASAAAQGNLPATGDTGGVLT